MKRIHCILLAVASLAFVACDPGYTCDSVVNNVSGHSVTINPLNYTVVTQYRDTSIKDAIYNSDFVALNSDERAVVVSTGGIGYASREECIYNMRLYLGDSVEFTFDDNKKVIFYATDTTGVSPYNFNATFYHYVQDLAVNRGKVGDPKYGTLTLNLDDTFYQQAQ